MISSLDDFARAGVLSDADVHLARTLVRLDDELPGAEPEPSTGVLMLAIALAARAPRMGHTMVALEQAALSIVSEPHLATDDLDPDTLIWPDPATWSSIVAASPLVSTLASSADRPDPHRPLVLIDDRLCLQRYWATERLVAERLNELLSEVPGAIRDTDVAAPVLDPVVAEVIGELLHGDPAQLDAVVRALDQGVTVLIGGPGTGKTTTVAALLVAIARTAAQQHPDTGPSIALAAPTGKAAARLTEAVRSALARLPAAAPIADLEASTIHRLIGLSGRSPRYGREHRLPHDLVVVDESSMVSLPLMARLLDALRPGSRLVLVGDADQLTSVEAGSVLADVVAAAEESSAGIGASSAALARTVVRLERSHRFPDDSPIGRLAAAVRAGDAELALAELEAADQGAAATDHRVSLSWIDLDGDDPAALEVIDGVVLARARESADAARRGDTATALASLEAVRVLCAHRRGRSGVQGWNHAIEQRLDLRGRWYAGRPVMVTANDYRLNLFNGDLGVVALVEGRPRVAFASAAGRPRLVEPGELAGLETVHAMTIHKSQGSEFDEVVIVVPPADSRLATRELLYTAITRARRRVTVIGSRDAIGSAVRRRVRRATGLREVLLAVTTDH